MPGRFTISVGLEGAELEPTEFVAVTTTRMREPKSSSEMVYVFPVAPAMSEQRTVLRASQRRHWYANVMGSAPDHVPSSVFNVFPT